MLDAACNGGANRARVVDAAVDAVDGPGRTLDRVPV
jgi:hypothetical protein